MSLASLAAAGPCPATAEPQQRQKRSSDADFPALEAIERDVARLVERTRPSVVSIIARTRVEELLAKPGREVRSAGPTQRVGSGVVIDGDGHVATLTSVVSGASEIVVLPADGRRRSATIRGLDRDSGLAVLAVEGIGSISPVDLGQDDQIRVGSFVTAFGNPQADAGSYSVGFVAGKGMSHGPLRRGPYLRLNASTAPGAGGGPVVDSRGRLVGIVFGGRGSGTPADHPAISWQEGSPDPDSPEPLDDEAAELDRVLEALHRAGSAGSGVSYAIPVDVVRRVTEQIIRSGSVRRGWVGVTIESPEPGEIRLARVTPGGPAEKAGLKVGDLIVALDGASIPTAESLVNLINMSPPDARLTFGIKRGEARMQVPVLLGIKPQHEAFAWPQMAPTPRPNRTRLGVVLVEPSAQARKQMKAPEGLGLLVQEVIEGTRAAAAGLEEGDLVLEALGIKIANLEDLRRALREQDPSRDMELHVIRADGEQVVLLVPPPPPPPPRPAPAPSPAARQPRPPAPN